MAAKGYWREISAVLVAKTIGILALYFLVVASLGPAQPVTSASVAAHLAPAAADGTQP
jgi:hypothetical protein